MDTQLIENLPGFYCAVREDTHEVLYGSPRALHLFGDDSVGKDSEKIGTGSTLMFNAGEKIGDCYEYNTNLQGKWYWVTQYAAQWDGLPARIFFGVDYGQLKNFDGLPSVESDGKVSALEQLDRHVRLFRRGGAPSFTVCFIDIDGLKAVNDTLGRGAGDEYVRTVSAVLQDSMRQTDLFLPMGGDEFLVLFPKCSAFVAEKILGIVAGKLEVISAENELDCTYSVSYGVYEVTDTEQADTESIMAVLQQRMREMKRDLFV